MDPNMDIVSYYNFTEKFNQLQITVLANTFLINLQYLKTHTILLKQVDL